MDIEAGPVNDGQYEAMPPVGPQLVAAHSAPGGGSDPEDDELRFVPMLRSVSEPAPGHEAEDHLRHPIDAAEKKYLRGVLQRISAGLKPYRGRRNSWLPVPLFHCGICLENEREENCFSFSACAEAHKYCKDCASTYVRVQINDGVTELMCPHPGCSTGHVSDAEVALLVDKMTYQKFITFKEAKSNPNMRVCGSCGHHCYGSKEDPSITCECGAQFCFLHDLAHPNVSCAVYASRIRKTELESDCLVRRITKKCPSCHADTIKNGGCNHMTCASCRENWCWICGRVMGPGHFDAGNIFGCPGGQFRNVPETNSCISCAHFATCVMIQRVGLVLVSMCWSAAVMFVGVLLVLFGLVAAIPALVVMVLCVIIVYPYSMVRKNDMESVKDVVLIAGACIFAPIFACLVGSIVLLYIPIALAVFPIVFVLYFETVCNSGDDCCDDDSFLFRYFLLPVYVLVLTMGLVHGDDD